MKESKIKMCDLHSEGVLKRLAREATVLCSRCGAKAHNSANLCDPVELFDVSS